MEDGQASSIHRTDLEVFLTTDKDRSERIQHTVVTRDQLLHENDNTDATGYIYLRVPDQPQFKAPQQRSTVQPISSNVQTKSDKGKDKPPQTFVHDVIDILDTAWITTFKKCKTIRLQHADKDCKDLCEAMKRKCQKCTFVDVKGDLNVIVVKKTTRVQSDAEMAIQHLGIGSNHRHDTVLFIFHRVQGSKSMEDVLNVTYKNDTVKETLHIPYKEYD